MMQSGLCFLFSFQCSSLVQSSSQLVEVCLPGLRDLHCSACVFSSLVSSEVLFTCLRVETLHSTSSALCQSSFVGFVLGLELDVERCVSLTVQGR